MAEQTKKDETAKDQGDSQTDPVVITFTKPWSRYSRGDVAGFSAKEAERLIKGKVAVKGTKLPAAKADQEPEPKA
ncbi:hypothetical protein ACFQGA_09545 [Marinobacter koreensis]|uniref:Uncharacterized protein n=1 Tax=Marinobacter koreensis TaxID=335974 RepID=A0ABW0RMS0_9GAMM|nr:hypothetical protein [Marinobacter koreensis]MCK7547188.1 hypothetical protein [Marinobacter koreensis]